MFLLDTLQPVPESGQVSEPEGKAGSSHGACMEGHSHGQHLTECPGPWQVLRPSPPLQNSKNRTAVKLLILVPFTWTSTDPEAKSPH